MNVTPQRSISKLSPARSNATFNEKIASSIRSSIVTGASTAARMLPLIRSGRHGSSMLKCLSGPRCCQTCVRDDVERAPQPRQRHRGESRRCHDCSPLSQIGADSIAHHSRMRAITARVGALLHPAAARSSERADSLNAALLGLEGDLP